jgi:hypothetical protein
LVIRAGVAASPGSEPGLAWGVGALPVGVPAIAEVVLALAVALPLDRPGRRVAALLALAGRVGVGRLSAQRLGYASLANRPHPGALRVQVGPLLAVGQPLGQP